MRIGYRSPIPFRSPIRDRSPILLRVTFTDAHAPVTAPWWTPVAHWSAQLAVGSRQNALMSLRLCILLWECAERARVPVEGPARDNSRMADFSRVDTERLTLTRPTFEETHTPPNRPGAHHRL